MKSKRIKNDEYIITDNDGIVWNVFKLVGGWEGYNNTNHHWIVAPSLKLTKSNIQKKEYV